MIDFPVTLRFKLFAIASQISVRDAQDREVLYVKQKLFKLKEHVQVYRDSTMQELLFEIRADKMIDFSARYNFIHSATGTELGHISRQGMRSLWRASYDIYSGAQQQLVYHISEENPFVKLIDGAIEMIPIVGPILDIFQWMFLNPKYLVTDETRQRLAFRIIKKRSWHEGMFVLEAAQDPTSGETFDPYSLNDEKLMTVLLSVLMMVLLEKNRG
ncbi:MAG TPA: hypothetical protein VFH43_06125 [Candidatus Kapabacteria bacterium]|nr:hypothetical protein [Candidatus Kapabacteria bacterium]